MVKIIENIVLSKRIQTSISFIKVKMKTFIYLIFKNFESFLFCYFITNM